MKKLNCLVSIAFILLIASCQKNWLDREPKDILTNEEIWNDPNQVLSVLANCYDRIPTEMGVEGNWANMANYDDAMWSGQSNSDWRNNISYFGQDAWFLWDYTFIHDINLAIEKLETVSTLSDLQKSQFTAEFRFIRAYEYFEMARRVGGVPLITKVLDYDYSGDATNLRYPRAKEAEVYDFVGDEMDSIASLLGNDGSVSRANKYSALALKSRAMLYAGSLAKYNNLMASPISTPNGEVGIPADRSNDYYQKSLNASLEIINSGKYELYKANPDVGENFYEAIRKKTNNNEVIFVKDYLSSKNKRHFFAYDNIPRGIREDNAGSSSVTPSLGLVESFDYIDGSNGTLKTRTDDNTDYIYYSNLSDIFNNKDKRLFGTVILPGTTFKGLSVQMQAGVMVWDGSTYKTVEGSDIGTYYTDGKLLTGSSGPHRSMQEVTNTGFYLKKFVDDGPQTSTRGILSDVWWIWFRLGEIYLNASEAAFELGQQNVALQYINALRERAGFPANSLTTLSMSKIQNERRCELAFEDHRLWDLKRWRIADKVWDGSSNGANTKIYALYPYRIIRPGDSRDGKYVFIKMVAPRFGAARFFQVGNYYSAINQAVLNNNPLIVKNPFQ